MHHPKQYCHRTQPNTLYAMGSNHWGHYHNNSQKSYTVVLIFQDNLLAQELVKQTFKISRNIDSACTNILII